MGMKRRFVTISNVEAIRFLDREQRRRGDATTATTATKIILERKRDEAFNRLAADVAGAESARPAAS